MREIKKRSPERLKLENFGDSRSADFVQSYDFVLELTSGRFGEFQTGGS